MTAMTVVAAGESASSAADWWGIFWLVVLLLGNAYFVAAEFAVISARRSQIEPRAQAGSKAAQMTLWAMEHATRMFVDYPLMASDLFRQLFAVDGTHVRPLRKTLPPIAKRVGYLNLARDLWKGSRAL